MPLRKCGKYDQMKLFTYVIVILIRWISNELTVSKVLVDVLGSISP